ncbi:MAG: hypothetical protein WBO24_15475 [Nitrospirales bacterium]
MKGFGVRHEYLLTVVHRIPKVKQQSAQWLYPGNAGFAQRFRSNRYVRGASTRYRFQRDIRQTWDLRAAIRGASGRGGIDRRKHSKSCTT